MKQKKTPGSFISTQNALSRRSFLRGAGILLSLPLLDAMQPAFASAAASASPVMPDGKPRRMLAICNNLGLLPEEFFPTQAGRDYKLSPYLEALRDYRNDFTVFSGVSHPDVDGGHPADNCFLTAAPHPGRGGFRNTISLDQYMAERIGHLTRFPSLTLGVNVQQGMRSLSWTSSGVLIPCEEKAADVFTRLFLRGTPEEMEQQVRRLEHPRRRGRPSEIPATLRWGARPRPAGPIFHQRPRAGAADEHVKGMGARAEAKCLRLRPARSRQPQGLHGKGEADV